MEHADSALLSPSFVNLNNNISNIEQAQKTNTNNEEERFLVHVLAFLNYLRFLFLLH